MWRSFLSFIGVKRNVDTIMSGFSTTVKRLESYEKECATKADLIRQQLARMEAEKDLITDEGRRAFTIAGNIRNILNY